MENTTTVNLRSGEFSALDFNATEYYHFPEVPKDASASTLPCCRDATHAACRDQLGFYSVLLPVIIGFTVVASLVSCVVTCSALWVKRPMSPSVRLSLSLSAANTLFAITWTSCLVINMYLRLVVCVVVPGCLVLTLEVLRLGSIVVQVMHLLAVALSHYLGSLRPLQYLTTATPTALRLTLAAVWIIPLAGVAVVFASVPGQGYQSQDCANNTFYEREMTFRLAWSCIFFGPTVVIVLVYCHIFYLLRQRYVYLQDTPQAAIQRFNVKMVRLSAMFVVTFLLGWGPAVAKFVLVCDNCLISDLDLATNMYLGAVFNALFTLKVFTDTFIYAVRLPAVAKALRDMWVTVRSCGRSSRRGWNNHRRISTSLRTVSFSLSNYTSSSIQRLLEGVRTSIQGHVRTKGGRGSHTGTRTKAETETEILPTTAFTQPTSEDSTTGIATHHTHHAHIH